MVDRASNPLLSPNHRQLQKQDLPLVGLYRLAQGRDQERLVVQQLPVKVGGMVPKAEGIEAEAEQQTYLGVEAEVEVDEALETVPILGV